MTRKRLQVCIVTVQLKYFVDFCIADCLLQKCNHKRAYKWVECEKCFRWYHQICVRFKGSLVPRPFTG